MTQRVVIFGNSHIAALKYALRETPHAWPDMALTLVGAHREHLINVAIIDGILRPVSDDAKRNFNNLNGCEQVDLNQFDAVAISGCEVTFNHASVLYKNARWPELPSIAKMQNLASMRERLVSVSLFDTCLRDALVKSIGVQLAHKIKTAQPDLPVFVLGQPRACQKALDGGNALAVGHQRIVDKGDTSVVSARFDDIATQLLADMGITFLAQPENTRTDDIFTSSRFTDDAMRLSSEDNLKQPQDDVLHANAAYGAVVLSQLGAALAR